MKNAEALFILTEQREDRTMKLRNFGLKSKLTGLGALPVLLAVILAIIAGYSVKLLLASVYQVDDSNKVIRKSMAIAENALEMQTGMRGFLLTGEEAFLDGFLRSEKQIAEEFASAKNRIRTGEQSAAMDEAEKVLSTWKKGVADPAIALRREIGNAKDMNDMSDLVRQNMTKKYFERFCDGMQAFIDKEKAAFVTRQKEQARERDPMRLPDAIAAVDYASMVIELAMQVRIAADDLLRVQLWYVLSGKEEFMAPYKEAKKKVFVLIDQLKEAAADEPHKVKALETNSAILEEWIYVVLDPELLLRWEIAKSKTMVDMKAYVAKGEDKTHFDKFANALDRFREKEDEIMASRQKAADLTASQTQWVLMGGTGLIVIAALLLSYLMAGRITRPLSEAMDFAASIGSGDLTRTLSVRNKDEIGRLSQSLNVMAENLRNQIGQLLEGVQVLNSSATEISVTVSQVSSGATQISTSVTETTSTVEELRQAASMATQKAKGVVQAANEAEKISTEGKRATDDTVDGMNLIRDQMTSIGETVVRLSEHSKAIEDIISTVQDLADQSNLLAVNASIEAARAGEQGRGFSVVAHEIKSLAEQSREATTQVRSILEDTRKWVGAAVMATEQGSKAVAKGLDQSVSAGKVISVLTSSVSNSSQAASVIEASSDQQLNGMNQIVNAMTSVDAAVRQNIAGMQQLSDSARRLADLGHNLQRLAENYKM